ncbi:hypothetical protein O6H91_Y566900 [Diphasiastrum complanatum]|nr:hypothetical protein O6H91_Y566900 [Diphasiastrum complanatum]
MERVECRAGKAFAFPLHSAASSFDPIYFYWSSSAFCVLVVVSYGDYIRRCLFDSRSGFANGKPKPVSSTVRVCNQQIWRKNAAFIPGNVLASFFGVFLFLFHRMEDIVFSCYHLGSSFESSMTEIGKQTACLEAETLWR